MVRTSSAVKIIPVIRSGMDETLFPNHVKDDIGDNIYDLLGYKDLSPYFGELTAMYWMWKNSSESHVGLCHYRRFWDEDEILSSEEDGLYVSKPTHFGISLLEQYYNSHPKHIIDMPKILYDCVDNTLLTKEMLDETWNGGLLYCTNLIRGPKRLIEPILEIYFEVIFEIWNRSKDLILKIDHPYQKRAMGFISERIMTTILLNSNRLVGIDGFHEATTYFLG